MSRERPCRIARRGRFRSRVRPRTSLACGHGGALTQKLRLRSVARAVAVDWALELGHPFHGTHSYVTPAGPAAVLKIVPPDDQESDHEAAALAFWNGDGAVRPLRHDSSRKALLLERALPGDDLSQLSEGE